MIVQSLMKLSSQKSTIYSQVVLEKYGAGVNQHSSDVTNIHPLTAHLLSYESLLIYTHVHLLQITEHPHYKKQKKKRMHLALNI